MTVLIYIFGLSYKKMTVFISNKYQQLCCMISMILSMKMYDMYYYV